MLDVSVERGTLRPLSEIELPRVSYGGKCFAPCMEMHYCVHIAQPNTRKRVSICARTHRTSGIPYIPTTKPNSKFKNMLSDQLINPGAGFRPITLVVRTSAPPLEQNRIDDVDVGRKSLTPSHKIACLTYDMNEKSFAPCMKLHYSRHSGATIALPLV